jgi:hypothetical protein
LRRGEKRKEKEKEEHRISLAQWKTFQHGMFSVFKSVQSSRKCSHHEEKQSLLGVRLQLQAQMIILELMQHLTNWTLYSNDE